MIDTLLTFYTNLSGIEQIVFAALAGTIAALSVLGLRFFKSASKANQAMLFHQGRADAYEKSNTKMINELGEANKALADKVVSQTE